MVIYYYSSARGIIISLFTSGNLQTLNKHHLNIEKSIDKSLYDRTFSLILNYIKQFLSDNQYQSYSVNRAISEIERTITFV